MVYAEKQKEGKMQHSHNKERLYFFKSRENTEVVSFDLFQLCENADVLYCSGCLRNNAIIRHKLI